MLLLLETEDIDANAVNAANRQQAFPCSLLFVLFVLFPSFLFVRFPAHPLTHDIRRMRYMLGRHVSSNYNTALLFFQSVWPFYIAEENVFFVFPSLFLHPLTSCRVLSGMDCLPRDSSICLDRPSGAGDIYIESRVHRWPHPSFLDEAVPALDISPRWFPDRTPETVLEVMDARGRGYCYWGVVLREATTSLYNLPVPPESDTSWQVNSNSYSNRLWEYRRG